jgi:hypothetical protein
VSTERIRAAQAILAVPLFDELMDDLERAAVNSAIAMKYEDHEARYGHLATARAIRDLRSRLAAIANEGQANRKQAPA